MKHRKTLFIKGLKRESREGRRFTDLFLVVRKNLATSSTGRPYLRLTLADSSDSIEAFLWEGAAEVDGRFAEGDLVEVRGAFKTYQGSPQISVEFLERLSAEDLAGIERLPDIETLVTRLKVEAVKDPQPEVHIRGDAEVRYESVGRVVVACQRAGIFKVGFITEPPAGTPNR